MTDRLRRWMIAGFVGAIVVGSQPSEAAQAASEPAGPYQRSWQSLKKHQIPQWLLDAKFGIYAHWGVYSVPAYGNEWYAKWMYNRNHAIHAHHVKTYGDPSTFGYKDFVPMFKAERFDPQAWADLIAESGAKFAGIAVVHHDGFGLWDSDVNRWNAGKMGPKRDLYGELVQALRQKPDMKIIATFHHIRTFDWFLPSGEKAIAEARQAGWDLFDPRYADFYWNRFTGSFDDFIVQWKAKVKEVIDKYAPDVLWFDGGRFQEANAEHHVLEVLSYYLNRAAERHVQVEVLNKLPSTLKFNFPEDFGMLTFEEGRHRPVRVPRPWIDDMKISTASWGYIEGQEYRPVDEIIDGLVDRVSRGGGLLLNLSPKADGTIPEAQQQILRQMGRWLRQNGEAIYGTRPWKIHAEGPTEKLMRRRGRRWLWEFKNCDAGDIRFTRKGDTLYAITLGCPTDGRLMIRTLGRQTVVAGGIRRITLLGSDAPIRWRRGDDGLMIRLPEQLPNEWALAFRVEVDGALEP